MLAHAAKTIRTVGWETRFPVLPTLGWERRALADGLGAAEDGGNRPLHVGLVGCPVGD